MAELNPNIILQSQVPNFGETYGNALLAGSQIAEKRSKVEKEQTALKRAEKLNALTAAIPEGVNRRDYLTQKGFGAEALELDKAEGEADKVMAEGGIKSQEQIAKQVDNAGRVLQRLLGRPDLSKATAQQELDASYQAGEIAPNLYQKAISTLQGLPEEGLREHIKSQVMALQSAKDQMTYVQPDANAQLQAQTQAAAQDITRQNNQFNQGLNQQEFGFNQSKFERQQAFDEAEKTAKFNLDLQKRKDSLNPRTSGKAPTEFQGKSALYANRAEEAEKMLSTLDYSPAAIGTKEAFANTPLIGGMMGAGANMMLSDNNQKAEQAQRNFVNAILRQESGAVISPAEFENAKKQYFPAVGDSDAVKAQKAANRRTAIDSIRNNAEGVMDTSIGSHGASGSWTPDNPQVIEKANKHGLTPEQYLDALKKNGLLQ